jgi:signal transduction histidine kinase
MLRLPELFEGSSRWRLPLPNDAASWLLAALVADAREVRVERCERALRAGPSFVLWLVCRGSTWREHPPGSFRRCAEELEQQALSLLARSESSSLQFVDSPLDQQCEPWSRRSIAVARAAAQAMLVGPSSESASQEVTDRAYLLGLLHGAREWMDAYRCDASNVEEEGAEPPFPSWLDDMLRDLAAPSDRVPAIEAVAGAMNKLGHAFGESSSEPQTGQHDGAKYATGSESPDPALLAQSLPGLLARLKRLKQLETDFAAVLQQEKLESLRELAYGASHEINNPLANISTRAQTLLRDESDPERRRKLATINTQAFRAHEMIADMMLFAKPPDINPETVDVGEVVDEVLSELEPNAAGQGTRLEFAGDESPLRFEADRVQLTVALKSLCFNALEALGAAGCVQITARSRSAEPGQAADTVEIQVRDSGPGIPDEVRRHLFDPFYSGREAGRGLGLGLSKCWRIVTLHGGQIDVESRPGEGACFTLRFPAHQHHSPGRE